MTRNKVFGAVLTASMLAACEAAPIVVEPVVNSTGVSQRFDADAVVWMTEAERGFVYSGGPSSFWASGVKLRLPLGEVMMKASLELYSRAFRNVRSVRSLSEAPQDTLVIHPVVEDYRWEGGFTGDTSRTTTSVSLLLNGREIFQRQYNTEATAPLGMVGGSNLGPAAAKNIMDALVRSLNDIEADADVQQWFASRPERPRMTVSRPDFSTGQFPTRPLSLTFGKAESRPDDIAVIIGNANYGKLGKDIPNVIPAYADAEGMKRYATQALGIETDNIIFLRDATQADFIATFGTKDNYKGQLYDWIEPGQSRVFVYYSGHGAPSEEGTSYLVPVDAQAARIELNGYPLKTLYRNLSKLPAQSVTVVLEACFSGTSQAGGVISSASPVYLKAKEAGVPPNLTVIAAGTANQIASWEEDKSHGLFTKYFLVGLSGEADAAPYGNGDGKVGWNELKRYLNKTVTRLARRYYGRDQTVQIVMGNGG